MKKVWGILIVGLLVCNFAQAASLLPECKGTYSTKWTNCQGTYTYAEGNKYVGEWKDSYRHGQGTLTAYTGIKYVGEFKYDKMHGQGTLTAPTGIKYVGEFKDDKMHGQGTLSSPDGTKIVGEWKDGKIVGDDTKDGTETVTFEDRSTYVGEIQDSISYERRMLEIIREGSFSYNIHFYFK